MALFNNQGGIASPSTVDPLNTTSCYCQNRGGGISTPYDNQDDMEETCECGNCCDCDEEKEESENFSDLSIVRNPIRYEDPHGLHYAPDLADFKPEADWNDENFPNKKHLLDDVCGKKHEEESCKCACGGNCDCHNDDNFEEDDDDYTEEDGIKLIDPDLVYDSLATIISSLNKIEKHLGIK